MPRAGNTTQRGYGYVYRLARARLLASKPNCRWCAAKGIVRPATTADHDPPISEVGHPHLNLVPSCGPCNFARTGKTMITPSRPW